MADQKISQLPAADALDGSERIPLEQGGATKQIPSDTYGVVRDATVTVTVGSTGDYATITDALTALGRDYAAFVQDGFTAEVKLLSGFVMAEQVFIRRVDLGWVTITSEDATVTIDRSALTTAVFSVDEAAFYVEDGVGPVIDVQFDMDTSGTASNQTGIQLRTSRITVLPNRGVTNATRRGIDMHDLSHARIRSTVFDGAGNHGVRVGNRSSATFRDGSAANCGSMAVAAGNACHVLASNATLTGAGGSAVYSQGARVEADGADGTGATDDSFTVVDGGEISVHAASGTLSQPANIATDQGLIYSDTLEVPSVAAPTVPHLPASAPWQDANRALGLRLVIPRRAVYRYILFRVDVSSGNIEVGLLAMSGAGLLTATTVMSSGSIACPAAGYIRLDLGATTVDPGPHVLYIAADNTTFETFNATDSVALRAQRLSITTGSGPGSDFDAATWGHTTRYIGGIALEGDT